MPEAVRGSAVLAVQGEEALRVLAAESLDLVRELFGCELAISIPVTVADVVPVAVELPRGVLRAAPGCSRHPGWVRLPIAHARAAYRARKVDDHRIHGRSSL
jgi:hypothetical protein